MGKYENLLEYEYNGAKSMPPIEKFAILKICACYLATPTQFNATQCYSIVLMKAFYEKVLLGHHKDDYLTKRMKNFLLDPFLKHHDLKAYDDFLLDAVKDPFEIFIDSVRMQRSHFSRERLSLKKKINTTTSQFT